MAVDPEELHPRNLHMETNLWSVALDDSPAATTATTGTLLILSPITKEEVEADAEEATVLATTAVRLATSRANVLLAAAEDVEEATAPATTVASLATFHESAPRSARSAVEDTAAEEEDTAATVEEAVALAEAAALEATVAATVAAAVDTTVEVAVDTTVEGDAAPVKCCVQGGNPVASCSGWGSRGKCGRSHHT